MKLNIYLTDGGVEKVAKGETPWYWDFAVRAWGTKAVYDEDTGEETGQEDEEPKCPMDNILVAEAVETRFPTAEAATPLAIAALEAKLQKHRADAYQEERDLQERIANLKAITYTAA